MRTLFGYLLAIAIGVISQFLKDHAWLATALLYTAFGIGVLATLSLTRDIGLLTRVAKLLRVYPLASFERDVKAAVNPAPRGQVPRPAGPAGPTPVLQKQPKSVNGEPIAK